MFKGKCYYCKSKSKLVRYAYAESWWWQYGRKMVTACDECRWWHSIDMCGHVLSVCACRGTHGQ